MENLNKLKKAELILLIEEQNSKLKDLKKLESELEDSEDDLNENYTSNDEVNKNYMLKDDLPEDIEQFQALVNISKCIPLSTYDKQEFSRIIENITDVKVQVIE